MSCCVPAAAAGAGKEGACERVVRGWILVSRFQQLTSASSSFFSMFMAEAMSVCRLLVVHCRDCHGKGKDCSTRSSLTFFSNLLLIIDESGRIDGSIHGPEGRSVQ